MEVAVKDEGNKGKRMGKVYCGRTNEEEETEDAADHEEQEDSEQQSGWAR